MVKASWATESCPLKKWVAEAQKEKKKPCNCGKKKSQNTSFDTNTLLPPLIKNICYACAMKAMKTYEDVEGDEGDEDYEGEEREEDDEGAETKGVHEQVHENEVKQGSG